ncbi:hypothetical protein BBD46_16350 [Natrialba sp. SSL1]|nr:hypothetical protein BBD46_16350 [Natrialba sp. SSL1]
MGGSGSGSGSGFDAGAGSGSDSHANEYAGDIRWGWCCPRCERDVSVTRDPRSETFVWACPDEECPAVGFGFQSRRRARIALREYRERYQQIYR